MRIVLYSKDKCTYCSKSKVMLDNLGLKYTEKKFENFDSVESFKKDIGKDVRTIPQIKINGELIGGYHQLIEYLDDQGLVNFKGEKVDQR